MQCVASAITARRIPAKHEKIYLYTYFICPLLFFIPVLPLWAARSNPIFRSRHLYMHKPGKGSKPRHARIHMHWCLDVRLCDSRDCQYKRVWLRWKLEIQSQGPCNISTIHRRRLHCYADENFNFRDNIHRLATMNIIVWATIRRNGNVCYENKGLGVLNKFRLKLETLSSLFFKEIDDFRSP